MRILFLNPEQYVSFEEEPSNYELRLPILNCGAVTAHRDYVYQRVLRTEGRKVMNAGVLREAIEFRPDLIVYSTSWPHEAIDSEILDRIMRQGIPVFTHVWDTHLQREPHELDWFLHCTYFGVADSVTNYRRYRALAETERSPWLRDVIFCAGNNVFTDVIRPESRLQEYDVTLLGSCEGQRVELVQQLGTTLARHGIIFQRCGGLINRSAQPMPHRSAQWMPIEQYIEVINRSKICISSQTLPTRRQIKGKVFHYLAGGAFCLTDSNPELRSLIPDGCVVYYESAADCIEKIRYYLVHDEERRRIAQLGHRWFCETFDYKTFWSQFLHAVRRGETNPSVLRCLSTLHGPTR